MSSSYYALVWSLEEQDRVRVRNAHSEWYKAIPGQCGIGDKRFNPPRASACIAEQYRTRASFYRGQITGDAAAEADLPPIVRVAIHKRLLSLGLMTGEPDGIFGAGTRNAFRAYRQMRGGRPSDFLSSQDLSELVRGDSLGSQYDANFSKRAPSHYSSQPDQHVDPRQIIPEVLSGMLGGGRPPRRHPELQYRQQELTDYPRENYRPLNIQGSRRGYSNRDEGRGEDESQRSDMAEFNPQLKSAANKPLLPAAIPEKKAAPPSEFSDSGSSIVTSPLGGKPRSSEASIRNVEVVGSGDTADAARKDASRVAIQQVAGVFVDNQRRIELSMTDNRVSEVVKEKLISYTNAYVSKIEVIKTEQKDGIFEVTANVSVSVAPLLKTLQENDIPTKAFDTATASATAQTIGEEKASASQIYLDLIGKVSSLLNVGVGSPSVDTSLPSTSNEAWLRIPLTFSVNDESMKEWSSKFKLIAQSRASLDFGLEDRARRQRLDADCTFPALSRNLTTRPDWQASFLSKQPVGNSYGVAACFPLYQNTSGISVECFGRTFARESKFAFRECNPNEICYDFDAAARNISLVIEFFGSDKTVVYGTKASMNQFPVLARQNSASAPRGASKEFINYCVGEPNPFYFVMNDKSYHRSEYGDVIIFPNKGAKVYAYYNILVPNNVISSISEVRARIAKSSSETGE
ncbi:hypothetical protein IPV08_10715 [Methylobacterium sp. SD274]|uniref:hypothetical protein n=1 Tax=Methylobacterium sp. SD274 TaxID=2782009 RepID=UPI001A971224|nr:hypothetical protein [Methylobacterium sp. SD274]MBO1020440.1 hypothetical protein [Methylobacterium sp. SD274]